MATTPLEQIAADVAECRGLLVKALNGDPGAGQPGIWIRLDRMERFVATMVWCIGVIGAGLVGLVIEAFTGHPMRK
jgi:hypothetical protein